jgi:putative ABC transport system permease protein
MLSLGLVAVSLLVSYRYRLNLGKETIISVIRAVVQLTIVGFVLHTIFSVNEVWLTLAMVLVIIFNAAWNAKGRSDKLPHAFSIALIAILSSTTITVGILVASGAIKFVPYQVIPFTGMVAGNSMVAVGLVFRGLNQQFKDQQGAIMERLALGSRPSEAGKLIANEAVRIGMQPTIDSIRTYGLVSLPGMMSGLIMAGVDPVYAIKYQIVVAFTLLSATAIASMLTSYMAVRRFFNAHWQLVLPGDTHH